MAQVLFGIDAVCPAGLKNGVDDHAGFGSRRGIAEQPVLPSNHDRADGILYLVVADLDFAAVEKSAQIRPLVHGIFDSVLQLAGGVEDRLQSGVVIVYNRLETNPGLAQPFFVRQFFILPLQREEPVTEVEALGSHGVFKLRSLRHGFMYARWLSHSVRFFPCPYLL